jgi:hypothetical protein
MQKPITPTLTTLRKGNSREMGN